MSAPDRLLLVPEPEPTPPPSRIRVRLSDCDYELDDGQRVCMTHRPTGVQASGSEDCPVADLLGAVQAEIDRLSNDVTWLGGMQVRGAGLMGGQTTEGGR